ncbi:Short-chain dehydrogenase [Amycolatopsis xylanica]|uniref:Short-chain dehydrogenase n=1 Tax=Amycolatopsis xylanica TaxID=589385 RepID=A0A1H3NBW6_9PSEU|nr:SDR family oxidoreductase [Amycolatopsis xylanica]SDY86160.1 Short-chain dehydrogenase [Amycolatopsis xylanica]
MPVALITGASAGLGLALTRALSGQGWTLVIDARGEDALRRVAEETGARAIAGDIADPAHRAELATAAGPELDLLVNNASTLGPSPLPKLGGYPLDELAAVYRVDVFAPLALSQLVLPALIAAKGTIINVSSDAAVEAYEGWGGYGSAKAALDQLTAVLGVENPELAVYAFDPGDMRTAMHQRAFPGEDISDRPEPETVVPAFLRLLGGRAPSGRYQASKL